MVEVRMVPFGGVENWQVLAGLIILTAFVCIAGTWIISLLVLNIYRGRVRRNMVLGRPAAISHIAVDSSAPSTHSVIIRPVGSPSEGPLVVMARRKSQRAQM